MDSLVKPSNTSDLKKYSIHNCYQVCLRDLQKEIGLERDRLLGMIEYVTFVKETPFVRLKYEQCLSFTKNSMWSTFCYSCLSDECEKQFKIFWPIIMNEQNFEQLRKYICTGHGVIQTLAKLEYLSDLETLIDAWEDKAALGQALLQKTNDFQNWSAFNHIAWYGNNYFATKVIDIVGNYYDNLNTEEQTKIGNELLEVCKVFVDSEDVQNLEIMFKRFKIDTNKKLDNGLTLLHVAARFKNIEMIDLLISLGADIETKVGYNGCTPLMLAVGEGNLRVVELLISRGANVHAINKRNESVLHVAINTGTDDEDLKFKLQFLIDNEAPVNAKNDDDSTPLNEAAMYRNHKVVNLLIHNGADVNIRDNMGYTPLHIAAWKGNLEIVKLLLLNGSNTINGRDSSGCIPIHLAAQYGDVEIVKCLIEHDSNLNKQDNMGDTPLHCAMVLEKRNFSSWKKTIEKKLNNLKESKRTYLYYNDEVVKHLIENGANVNVQNNEGYTPLYLAVVLERFNSAQLLFDAGADVNIKDNEEKSLLTTVIGSGHNTALEFLGRNNIC